MRTREPLKNCHLLRCRKILVLILSLLSAETTFAEMELFVSDSCSHCETLQQEITASELDRKFEIQIYEIYNDKENRDYYVYKTQQLGYQNAQVPLLIDGGIYKEGKSAILEYLKNKESGDDKPGSSNGLEKNDSEKLNELIKAEVDDSQKTKTLGLIAIIFGLTLFGTIIWRVRHGADKKKPHSN